MNGVKLYKIKWQGYGSIWNTWEPKDCLNDADDAINEFELSNLSN